MKRIKLILLAAIFSTTMAQAQRDFIRWDLAADGGITWVVKTNETNWDQISELNVKLN